MTFGPVHTKNGNNTTTVHCEWGLSDEMIKTLKSPVHSVVHGVTRTEQD